MQAVIDTNILVDYLRGVVEARQELSRYRRPAISLLTWMEILAGAQTAEEEALLRDFLHGFLMLPVTSEVAERAVQLRREHRIRLPDAIIWASAQVRDCLFVTRNTRDFPVDDPGVRVPYHI